jgi:hypothetical protein
MASRALVRERGCGAKFRARGAPKSVCEISFSIRTDRQKFFRALVLIAK